MRNGRKHSLRAVAAVTAVVLASLGLAATGAGAQTDDTTGVTNKAVKIGYISSQTGVASSTHKNAHRSCQARVDAQNAEGGVNGRKVELEIIDDQSSAANLTAATDLVSNRNVFAVIDNSFLAFSAYRYLKEQGVPMIGGGFDGTYYFEKGNENIISALGRGTPVPGTTYDNITKQMKKMGATKVGSLGYGISPSSSETARATQEYAAKESGLEPVYLNNTLPFGTTDVGPVALGLKNAGADAVYLPLDSDTNFAIVQALAQNGVKMKSTILATGYSQDLLDQPLAQTIAPSDVMSSPYRPVELGGKAIKEFQANLKKYAGITGVPDFGTYAGYVACDLMIVGLENAGKNLTRQGFIDGIRKESAYDGAGLTCVKADMTLAKFGTMAPKSCQWFVNVKNGKFVVLNGGKPVSGKLVGDPAVLAKYAEGATSSAATTTTAAP